MNWVDQVLGFLAAPPSCLGDGRGPIIESITWLRRWQPPSRVLVDLVPLRGPDHAGQVGGLPDGQVGGGDLEVGAGGRLGAVGAPAEVDGVQVALQDLVLGELPLELDGQKASLIFRVIGALRADGREGVADVLLGDGGAALADLAALRSWLGRPDDALAAHARVLEELPVLGGDHAPACRCLEMSSRGTMVRFSSPWRVAITWPSAASIFEDWAGFVISGRGSVTRRVMLKIPTTREHRANGHPGPLGHNAGNV